MESLFIYSNYDSWDMQSTIDLRFIENVAERQEKAFAALIKELTSAE